MSTTHLVKSWPQPFEALCLGARTAEFRRNDRGYLTGDLLVLQEWKPFTAPPDGDGEYTGRQMACRVTHVARGPEWGIPEGFAVLSLERLSG